MKIVFVGHSHINCIRQAAQKLGHDLPVLAECIQLRDLMFAKDPAVGTKRFNLCDQNVVEQAVATASRDALLTVICPTGNQHSMVSLVNSPNIGKKNWIRERINKGMEDYASWLDALCRYALSPVAVLLPPPPLESNVHITRNAGRFAELISRYGVTPPSIRLRTWLEQKGLIQALAAHRGVRCLPFPEDTFSENGFLNEAFVGKDATHANIKYGEAILRHVINDAKQVKPASGAFNRDIDEAVNKKSAATTASHENAGKSRHPYEALADRAFWKQAVAGPSIQNVDPVSEVPFKIGRSDYVATAGSCFAQHVSKRIRNAGLRFLVVEHPEINATGDGTTHGYYDFSARYGNIYTARQLLQLFDRAFGHFLPSERFWTLPGDRYCDPFRPRIEPNGFASVALLEQDRMRHLAAVREMFLELDVFVFTLGLTECWVSRMDGAAYPVAPGVAGGHFDPGKCEFVNFGVNEIVSDLLSFVRKLQSVNESAKIILTVSPVPLVATYEQRHVLVSNTYSKSALRVAAEMVSRSCNGVCYFPSYEIITGNFNRGRYFSEDLRTVTEEGVDHVMSLFMRHFVDSGDVTASASNETSATLTDSDTLSNELMNAAEAACDEELIGRK